MAHSGALYEEFAARMSAGVAVIRKLDWAPRLVSSPHLLQLEKARMQQ